MLRTKQRMLLLCAACALGVSAAVSAADRVSDSRQIYLQDRAFCLSGQSSQDQPTCLREAGAALQERNRGQLQDYASVDMNRFERCSYHSNPADREYCERRMRGEGTTSGSVEGGGLLRELVVIVPMQ